MGSREHDLAAAARTIQRTSSSVTSRQTVSDSDEAGQLNVPEALSAAAAVADTAVNGTNGQ